MRIGRINFGKDGQDSVGPFTREGFERHQAAFAKRHAERMETEGHGFTYTRVFKDEDEMSAWLRRVSSNEEIVSRIERMLAS